MLEDNIYIYLWYQLGDFKYEAKSKLELSRLV